LLKKEGFTMTYQNEKQGNACGIVDTGAKKNIPLLQRQFFHGGSSNGICKQIL